MATQARKISFEEAWDSTTIFYVDENLEAWIDAEVESLLEIAKDPRVVEGVEIEETAITDFLIQHNRALDVILKDIELSEEKFMRIISLLRRMGRISGGFSADDTEWSIAKVKRKIVLDPDFAHTVAVLLIEGKKDEDLSRFVPRYYLDALNYREIKGGALAARRTRFKQSMIGTYSARKSHKVERLIGQELIAIHEKHGIPFAKGRSRIINTDIDFAIPNIEDPWVIIMSSFQETTSSGQTNKTRDMLAAHIKVLENNSRNRENRAFVNFVDGGGWLARKRDLQRLVEQCHYFINMQHLDMLEAIILKHVPAKYIHST